MKTNIFVDIQICISVPLKIRDSCLKLICLFRKTTTAKNGLFFVNVTIWNKTSEVLKNQQH